MTLLLISPAEPARVRDRALNRLGGTHDIRTSPIPENHGVDFLWRARGAWHGAQRKELGDLIASQSDGRLSKEIGQMRAGVAHPIVIVERRPTWTGDGVLIDDGWGGEFTFQRWVSLHASLAAEGVGIVPTDSMAQTIDAIGALIAWSLKPSHTTATSRPGPTAAWGTASNRDWGVHMLQGVPGVGPGVAGDIYDHFGRVPLQWTVTEDELKKVPGVGPGRARKMLGALE